MRGLGVPAHAQGATEIPHAKVLDALLDAVGHESKRGGRLATLLANKAALARLALSACNIGSFFRARPVGALSVSPHRDWIAEQPTASKRAYHSTDVPSCQLLQHRLAIKSSSYAVHRGRQPAPEIKLGRVRRKVG
jgi:hypothetical protein